MPASRNWYGIAWNGSYYTVPAYGTAVMAVSKDGVSWRELFLRRYQLLQIMVIIFWKQLASQATII